MSSRWNPRYALRGYRRLPGFTVTALLVLALGAGIGVSVLGLTVAGLRSEPVYAYPPAVLGVEAAGGIVGWTDAMRTPAEVQSAGLRALLGTLSGLTVLVLAVALVNLGLLLLARAGARRREVAVRVALGARPAVLGRQFLLDAAILAGAGLAAGLVVAAAISLALGATWPGELPRWSGWVPTVGPAALVLGVVLATVIACVASPVAGAWRRDLRGALTTGTQATSDTRDGLLRRAVSVIAVGFTCMLVINAALLAGGATPGRTHAGAVPGQDMLTLTLELQDAAYDDAAERVRFYGELLAGAQDHPLITAESIASPGAWLGVGTVDVDLTECLCSRGGLFTPLLPERVVHQVVDPGFFQIMGLAVLDGRIFDEGDRLDAPRVAIVNRTYARESFARGEPVGRRVQLGGFQGEWYTVVGVVEDSPLRGIGAPSGQDKVLYLATLQHPPRVAGLAVRAAGDDPLSVAPAVATLIEEAGPGVMMSEASTLDAQIAGLVAPVRWFARLFAGLGAATVVLAVVAVYGVLAYGVQRRRRELGVRAAVGASPRRILRLVLGDGLRLTRAGLVLGGALAIGLARSLQQHFEGMRALDLATYAGVAALLVLVAALASLVPGRQAAGVEPSIALRSNGD